MNFLNPTVRRIYMRVYNECIHQGYPTQDARDFAEMETIDIMRDDNPLTDDPERTTLIGFSAHMPPLPVNPETAPKKIEPVPEFIKTADEEERSYRDYLWEGYD